MSNPTTPFSWQMPQNTDLVTDLPADFEVFGQAVATSMADLLGGTTGQLLSKASGTDMDFTWTTPNAGDITGVTAGTGISGGGTSGDVTVTNSMATAMTTSGDLIQATGSGTFARLGTGTNGQYLTTNGTTNSWASISAGGMTLLSTTTLSGATVTISSIDQTYKNLQLVIFGVTNATGQGRFAISGFGGTVYFTNNGPTSNALNDNSGNLELSGFGSSGPDNADASNVWSGCIDNYASTTARKSFAFSGIYPSSRNSRGFFCFGGINSTAAISSLTFSNTAGNLSTGTVLIYGVK